MRNAATVVGFGCLVILAGCVSLDKPASVAACSGTKPGCNNRKDAGGDTQPGAEVAGEVSSTPTDLPPSSADATIPRDSTAAGDTARPDTQVTDGITTAPDLPPDSTGQPAQEVGGTTNPDLPAADGARDLALDRPLDTVNDTPPAIVGACAVNGEFLAAGTVCRAAVGLCDLPEVCDGISPTCPVDTLAKSGTVCRRAAGDCDIAESCTGTKPDCPEDLFLAAGALCRPVAGLCDVAESCLGDGPACPLDAFAPAATVCRVSTDLDRCDPAEKCTGTGVTCPADAKYTRPAAPTAVTATPGSLSATIAWTGSTGATGYNVNRSITSGSGYSMPTTSPSALLSPYVDTGLTGGTTYYYIVSAINTVASCESSFSAPVSAIPVGLCTPPAAPVVTATPANGQVTLVWAAVTGAVSYTVARSTSTGTGYVSLATVTTGTTYADLAVVNGTAYYYVVTASNGSCSSDSSVEASAAPTCMPPAAPVDLQATAGNGTVALAWTASTGAVAYQILRSTTSGSGHTLVGTSTGATFTDTTVVNGTAYFYVVTAGNGACSSGNSAETTSTPACVPPSVPTALVATPGNNQIVLSWTAATGSATLYQVLRGTTTGGPYTPIGSPTATSYTDTTAQNGTAYFYVVTSSNGACASGNSAQATATPVCTPPTIPAGLAATPGNGQVALSWTATAAGTTAYQVLRGTASGGPFTLLGSPTTTNYTDATVANGSTYYYVVRSSNGTCASADSTAISATPAATCTQAAPTGVVATAGNKQVSLSWTAAAGATSYGIGRSTTNGSGYVSVGTATTTSYLDTDAALANGTTYYYVVTANGACSSPNSTQVSAAPACTPPAIPSGATATANTSNGQITVAWSPVATATAYTVSRGTALAGPFTAVSTNQTAASFTDSSALSAGSTYYYVVSASNGGGTCASANSTPAVSARSCTLPVVPVGLVATAQPMQVTLTWTASTGATSYQVLRGTASGGPYTAIATPTAATYVDTGVTADTTYYYVVTARNGEGNCATANSAQVQATPRACQVYSGGTATQFGTAGTFCLTTCDDIAGWGCSNYDGRSTTVNGSSVSCGAALPAKTNGAYTFRATAGTYSYAALYWWGTAKACP